MLDHYRAELLRYRGWAVAFAALHLVVLGFLTEKCCQMTSGCKPASNATSTKKVAA